MKQTFKKTKYYLFFIFSFALSLPGFSQIGGSEKITFTYDAAGNRVQRKTIVVLPDGGPSSKKGEEQVVTEQKEKTTFDATVFPNPTATELKVSVVETKENARISMSVSDLSGRKIRTINNAKATETISFVGVSNGIYVVEVVMDNQKRSWNIIKQE